MEQRCGFRKWADDPSSTTKPSQAVPSPEFIGRSAVRHQTSTRAQRTARFGWCGGQKSICTARLDFCPPTATATSGSGSTANNGSRRLRLELDIVFAPHTSIAHDRSVQQLAHRSASRWPSDVAGTDFSASLQPTSSQRGCGCACTHRLRAAPWSCLLRLSPTRVRRTGRRTHLYRGYGHTPIKSRRPV